MSDQRDGGDEQLRFTGWDAARQGKPSRTGLGMVYAQLDAQQLEADGIAGEMGKEQEFDVEFNGEVVGKGAMAPRRAGDKARTAIIQLDMTKPDADMIWHMIHRGEHAHISIGASVKHDDEQGEVVSIHNTSIVHRPVGVAGREVDAQGKRPTLEFKLNPAAPATDTAAQAEASDEEGGKP